MHIPLWSIVTLGTELLVTASVYFIIWRAYRTGAFLRTFAFVVLGYEVLFNISYMLSREAAGQSSVVYSPYETGLAIFHGTFSLVMFVALVAFFIASARAYARGENYFRDRPRLTLAFSLAWGVSILSGIAFFVALYFS
ncbi:MAG TPA: hypothetical protein PLW99_03565 [Candidatus Paceibacterota bacterium]|nr:MAG: hypothetical protein B7X03_02810 [Parcubacteria group bacterium 21-58-10]HQT83200.1 hypothetical protein [Candidatus Paceibacterota bacterium]